MDAGWMRILVLILAPAALFSAEPNRSWDVLVQTIKLQKSVVVKRMNSAQLEGKLLNITADSIRVQWHDQPHTIARDDVYRVRYANIRRRNTLTALAIGGAAGAIFGAAASNQTAVAPGLGALVIGGGWAGIGAAVGGALPIGAPLYEAAEPPRRSAQKVAE